MLYTTYINLFLSVFTWKVNAKKIERMFCIRVHMYTVIPKKIILKTIVSKIFFTFCNEFQLKNIKLFSYRRKKKDKQFLQYLSKELQSMYEACTITALVVLAPVLEAISTLRGQCGFVLTNASFVYCTTIYGTFICLQVFSSFECSNIIVNLCIDHNTSTPNMLLHCV